MEDNFLSQLVSEPTRGCSSLDLLFTDREELVGGVVVRDCLVHFSHAMIELLTLGKVKWGVSKTTTMDFQKADFVLFRTFVERIAWEKVLKGKEVQEHWTSLRRKS